MFIYETESAGSESAVKLSKRIGKSAECYMREDSDGCCLLASKSAEPEDGFERESATLLFTGGRYGAEAGEHLFKVGLWVPDDYRDELLAWYEQEHLPILLECPDWNGCRFAEVPAADGAQFYAIHQVARAEALDSEERKRSRSTPWFMRLAVNDWFDEPFVRRKYRRIAF